MTSLGLRVGRRRAGGLAVVREWIGRTPDGQGTGPCRILSFGSAINQSVSSGHSLRRSLVDAGKGLSAHGDWSCRAIPMTRRIESKNHVRDIVYALANDVAWGLLSIQAVGS